MAFSSHLKWVGPLQVIGSWVCSKVCGHEVALLSRTVGYPEIFSFSQALVIYRQYLLLRTVILQKKSLHNCSKFGDFRCSALFDRPNWLLRAR